MPVAVFRYLFLKICLYVVETLAEDVYLVNDGLSRELFKVAILEAHVAQFLKRRVQSLAQRLQLK